MKTSVYIETTIVSYLTAWPSRDVVRLSHEVITRDWWAKQKSNFDLYTSDFVVQEASHGDQDAAAERLKALADIPRLPISEAVADLAQHLADALSLPVRARLDAAHIAVSAVHNIQFLLTWNCRHLANGVLTPKIEKACAAFNVVAPRIVTPELLTESP